MKTLLFSSALILSFGVSAQTTIEFPLTGEIYKGSGSVELEVKGINTELRAKKLRPLPELVVWGKSNQRQWKSLIAHVELAKKTLNKDIDVVLDRGYFYEFPAICYRGATSEVPEVIESLMGTVLHPDQGIQALKYGKVKVVHYGSEFFENNKERMQEMLEYNPGEVKLWLNYNKTSDTVLILSDYGPQGDGTELTATEIKRCK